MVKTYLRYAPSNVHGLIVSPSGSVAVDGSGLLAFTAQLENIGIWNIRRGIQVSICRQKFNYLLACA